MEKSLENCNTATRSKFFGLVRPLSGSGLIGSLPNWEGALVFVSRPNKKIEKVGQEFVDRNERFVPLPRR